MWSAAASLCLALCAAVVPAAAGARPLGVGTGRAPAATVDRSGTAYIAYNATDGDVIACAIALHAPPRCTPHPVIADGSNAGAAPPLLAAPAVGTVELVSRRAGDRLYVSRDGARTFTDEGSLGDAVYATGTIAPGGEALVVDRRPGFAVSLGSVADPTLGRAIMLGGERHPAGESAVTWAGRTPLAVHANRRATTVFTFHATRGSLADPAAWRPGRRLGPSRTLAVANGGHGVYLLRQPLHRRWLTLIHRGRGGRLSPPHRAPRRVVHSAVGALALAEDEHGRLIAAWQTRPRDALVAAVSRDGVHWSARRVLARHQRRVGRMSLAVGHNGNGVLVWAPAGGGEVRALRVSTRSFLRHRRHRASRRA